MLELTSQRRRSSSSLSSLDFHTKSALILSVVTICGLLVLSLLYSGGETTPDEGGDFGGPFHRWLEEDNNNDENNNDDDYSKHSCNYIYEMTPDSGDLQCQFAKTCNGGQGVWAPFVFCSHKFSRTTLCIMLSPVILLWLVLLFRMLGSTAEDYFSPALEMFSTKLGLPPRFAGVSLLALGNGAADVSATVSAITVDPVAGYKLALGALTGAAMLISGVISAVVILTANGVPCRGALLRDVIALLVTVVTVWSQLASGTIGSDTVSVFLALYVIFVLLVLAADVYHRAVVLPRLAAQGEERELQRQVEAANEVPSTPPPPATSATGRFGNVLTAFSNYDNATDEQQQSGWGVESEDLAQERPIHLHGRGGLLDRTHPSQATPSSIEQDPDNAYAALEDTVDHACVQPGSLGIPADSWLEALQDGKDELLQHGAQMWDDIMNDGDLHLVSKFLLVCELPFTVLRKMTVPIPCEGYYCRALIAFSLALSPFWVAYYLHGHEVSAFSGGRWIFFIGFEVFICLCALAVLRFAPGGEGELALVFATPLALYGFVVAATWIDTIADALVSLLNFIGIILRIPGPVIGLTILAWGNSMSDLSANVTMARKGLANMAMTACFAGPVFNILVGLGLGFSASAAKTNNAEADVSLSPSVVTGFVFIAINAAAILGVGIFVGKGRIPKQHGYLALGIYILYLISSITLQYSKYGDES